MSKALRVATKSPEDKALALSSDDRGFIQTTDYSSDIIMGRFVEPTPPLGAGEEYIGSRGVFGVRALSYYPVGDMQWVDNRSGMCVNKSIVYVISEGKVKSFTANLKPLKTYDLGEMYPLSDSSSLIPNELTGETLVVDKLGKVAVINGTGVLREKVLTTSISLPASVTFNSTFAAYESGWIYADNNKINTLSRNLVTAEFADLNSGVGLTGSKVADLIVDEEVSRKAHHIKVIKNTLIVFCGIEGQSVKDSNDVLVRINLINKELYSLITQESASSYGFYRTTDSVIEGPYIYYIVYSTSSDDAGVYRVPLSLSSPPTQILEGLHLRSIGYNNGAFILVSGDLISSKPLTISKYSEDFALDWELAGFFEGGGNTRTLPNTMSRYGDIYISSSDGVYRLAIDLQLKGYTFNE